MRSDYQRERTSVLTWLLCALAAGFVVQFALSTPWLGNGSPALRALALTPPGIRDGWVWTLLTHSFLHNPHFLVHVVGNLFALYLLGRELLPMLGRKRFLGVYAAATIMGGLAWSAVHWRGDASQSLMGATAAVDALFIVFACFFPNQELNFLLFFLFPVTLKPKHMAGALVAFDLLGLMFWELPGTTLPYGATIASSAHLGGMLTGFAFYRFVFDTSWFGRSPDGEVELPRWLKRAKKIPALPAPEPTATVPAEPENLRAEVDRILDKINSHGFGALTPEEKRVLASARNQLSRH